MEAIQFVHKYESYLDDIQLIVKPELYPVLDEFREIDPHDLVTPETWFPQVNAAKGYVCLNSKISARKSARENDKQGRMV